MRRVENQCANYRARRRRQAANPAVAKPIKAKELGSGTAAGTRVNAVPTPEITIGPVLGLLAAKESKLKKYVPGATPFVFNVSDPYRVPRLLPIPSANAMVEPPS